MPIDPLNPKDLCPARISGEYPEGSLNPAHWQFRRGHFLEAAAHQRYGSPGIPHQPEIQCAVESGTGTYADCVHCILLVADASRRRVKFGSPKVRDLPKSWRQDWPEFTKLWSQPVPGPGEDADSNTYQTWLGTPDRWDLVDNVLVATEFKSATAPLNAAQSSLGEIYAELGIAFRVVNLSFVAGGGLLSNSVVEVPYKDNPTLTLARGIVDEQASHSFFGTISLAQYWRSKGIDVADSERVVHLQFWEGAQPSYYPAMLVRPLQLQVDLRKASGPATNRVPWWEIMETPPDRLSDGIPNGESK